MNRNTQAHFAELPQANIGRSKFDRGFTHTTTFNTGELVPVYVDCDIVPGDTVTMRQSEIVRMMTPICPVMDNAFMDFYWFFVPDRLVWDNFKRFMGENDTAPWTQTVDRTIPQINISSLQMNENKCTSNVIKGSVLEKMGIPTHPEWTSAAARRNSITSLPSKAYCLIWNEFFRDENLQNPVNITKTDADATLINENHASYISNPDSAIVNYEQYGGLPCLKVCKPHDYFTSCLPGAQKGPSVSIPLYKENVPLTIGQYYNTTDHEWQDYTDVTGTRAILTNSGGEYIVGNEERPTSFSSLPADEAFRMYTDLSQATGATVTALRQAFAIQKYYERDARGGWANA